MRCANSVGVQTSIGSKHLDVPTNELVIADSAAFLHDSDARVARLTPLIAKRVADYRVRLAAFNAPPNCDDSVVEFKDALVVHSTAACVGNGFLRN